MRSPVFYDGERERRQAEDLRKLRVRKLVLALSAITMSLLALALVGALSYDLLPFCDADGRMTVCRERGRPGPWAALEGFWLW